jgi:hypothetical protein
MLDARGHLLAGEFLMQEDAHDIVWQDAWFLLALRWAQGDRSHANLAQIDAAADAINHARILQREIDHAIKVLEPLKLVAPHDNGWKLGSAFDGFWTACGAGSHRAISRQMSVLTEALRCHASGSA